MQPHHRSYGQHFSDALTWCIGTTLFGLCPYLFLLFIGWLSEEGVTDRELAALADVRYIVFVCCTVTGAVVFSFIRARITIKGALPFFAVYISPFLLLLYVFLKFLLVYVQLEDVHDFGPGIMGTRMIIVFSVLYSLLAKTLYFIKRDYAGRNIDL